MDPVICLPQEFAIPLLVKLLAFMNNGLLGVNVPSLVEVVKRFAIELQQVYLELDASNLLLKSRHVIHNVAHKIVPGHNGLGSGLVRKAVAQGI